MITVTILMDDENSENKSLKTEHGLSMWFSSQKYHFLFDCGASGAAIYNANKLGINLASADFTICTHSHYDHAAGYRNILENGLGGKIIYTGPDFFEPKYAFDGKKYINLSCGFTENFIQQHHIKHCICTGLLPIANHCWLIGNFTRENNTKISKRFVKGNPPHTCADNFSDEICLVIESCKGLIMFVGCSHPGILNMVKTVKTVLNKPVYALIGGTHLVEMNDLQIKKIFDEMKRMGICALGLNHCSGHTAQEILKDDKELIGWNMPVGSCFVIE